ncbi:MAG: peptidoglycan-binding domain-containing protein [bacterium]
MKRIGIFFLLVFLLLVPATAHADNTCTPGKVLPPCTCEGTCQLLDFVQLFINLYTFGVQIAAPLAIFFIIVGGVILVTAAGYSNRIDMGKTIITQAVTGLIIVLISWIIVDTAIFLITGNKDRMVFGKPWFGGFTYACENTFLYQGCTGGNVSNLQNMLKKLAYPLTEHGTYGTETTAAVALFQRDVNNAIVINAATACGGRTGGTDVWNVVFRMTCPAGPCVTTQDEVSARVQTATGSAVANTVKLLQDLQVVSTQFIAACKM